MPVLTCKRPQCKKEFFRRKDCVLRWLLDYCCADCRKKNRKRLKMARWRAKQK